MKCVSWFITRETVLLMVLFRYQSKLSEQNNSNLLYNSVIAMMGYGSDSLETSLRLPSDLANRWLPHLKNTMAPLRVQSHSNKAEKHLCLTDSTAPRWTQTLHLQRRWHNSCRSFLAQSYLCNTLVFQCPEYMCAGVHCMYVNEYLEKGNESLKMSYSCW